MSAVGPTGHALWSLLGMGAALHQAHGGTWDLSMPLRAVDGYSYTLLWLTPEGPSKKAYIIEPYGVPYNADDFSRFVREMAADMAWVPKHTERQEADNG